ncbi:MAG TPA: response regulator [Candidatus Sulfotelmatobacter sp.]|jgi:DNA-binding response OmpR family regulator|nr:response regulator [Candidatus Sulfotelmatobacter sp.]
MKILLIEDDAFFRRFYSSKLREKNIEVEAASDGEEGLKQLQTYTPDLVLLDIIMPKKDGFDVLREMAQLHLIPKIPVLVFSTLGQEKDIEKARMLGARGYVNKSFFDFDKLYARILSLGEK